MSLSNINGKLNELDKINTEIKRITEIKSKLIDTKKTLENDVYEYLKHTNQEGIKHGNKIITLHKKKVHKRKKKVEREDKAIEFLTDMGFKNPQIFYKKYNDAIQNEIEEKPALKIKEKK
jgi:hypothetical protein